MVGPSFLILVPADRVYPEGSPATKATDVVVPAAASAGAVLRICIDACLGHLSPNESCWLETEHPDCLHQTRVSTRRLRALLSLSRELVRQDPVAMDLKARLRLILRPLGPARDLDVALARAHAQEWDPSDVERLERARAQAYTRVREVLSGATWKELWADFERWRYAPGWFEQVADLRDGPARRVTDPALDRRYRRIVLAGPQLLTMSELALHRLRIEGKKLRYGCQFFDGLYPAAGTVVGEDGEPQSAPLHLADLVADMQDAFGAFNDYAMARALREELSLSSGADEAKPTRLECAEAWERVAATPPFWRLC